MFKSIQKKLKLWLTPRPDVIYVAPKVDECDMEEAQKAALKVLKERAEKRKLLDSIARSKDNMRKADELREKIFKATDPNQPFKSSIKADCADPARSGRG